MNREILLAQFEKVIPLAARWAEALEARILHEGVPLSEGELADARALGVRQPERVRLLCLASVPTPDDLTLRTAAAPARPAASGWRRRRSTSVKAERPR